MTLSHSHIGKIGRDANGVRFAVTGETFDGEDIGAGETPWRVLILRGGAIVQEISGRVIAGHGSTAHASYLKAPIAWEDA